MDTSKFNDLMKQHGIIVGIVASLASGEVTFFGDRAALESDDIVRQYFEDISTLDQSLEGRLLPRMVQQGRVAAVICKPNSSTIVGLIYHDERDVVHRYNQSKVLNQEFGALWS